MDTPVSVGEPLKTDTGTEPSTSDTRINPETISLEVCDVIDADYKDGGVW